MLRSLLRTAITTKLLPLRFFTTSAPSSANSTPTASRVQPWPEKLNEMEDGRGIWNAWCGENDDQLPHAITKARSRALLRRFDRNSKRARSR